MPHSSASQPPSPCSRQSAKHQLMDQAFAEDQPAEEFEESPSKSSSFHQRKALWAGGVITLLAMATILPTQVSSQAITNNKCEQVIKSGSEISRAQLSTLASIPEGSTKEAVRQVVLDPYCILPAQVQNEAPIKEAPNRSLDNPLPDNSLPDNSLPDNPLQREAYPLAFDRDAWLVMTYQEDEYKGYDFVFKR